MFRKPAVSGFLLVLLALLLSAGCGGGGKSSTPGGGSGGTVTDAQRKAVLDAVQSKFPTLDGDPPTVRQAVKKFLLTLPQIEAADVDETSECVWARFTDHVPLIVVNNRKKAPTSTSRAFSVTATRAAELPTNAQIRILNTLGTSFTSPAATIRTWLTGNGYSSVSSDTSLDALKTVSGDGVFYLDAHGGVGQLLNGRQSFAIWTSTPATVDTYNALRTSGDVDPADPKVVMMYALHNGSAEWHFGITAAFVDSYMSFGANSLVFFNACLSNSSLAQSFQAACLTKGASVYAGWTRSVDDSDANYAAQFLFDRLIGGNQATPMETPPQRPFNWQSVYADMQSRGLDTSTDQTMGDCKLIFTPNPNADQANFTQLAPSISSMLVTNNQTQLQIFGTFGSTPGTVTIGGQSMTLQGAWTPNALTCTLPPGDQPGSYGDVVIEVNGHKSNFVPLTAWKITLHSQAVATASGTIVVDPASSVSQELDADLSGSSTTSGDMEIWIRADVHGARNQSGGEPQIPTARNYPLANGTTPTKNIKITHWDGSGTIVRKYHNAGMDIFSTETTTLSPTGSLPVPFDGSDPRGHLDTAAVTIDAQAHTLQLFAALYGSDLFESTVTNTQTGTKTQVGGDVLFHLPNTANGTVPLNIALASDFSVQGNSQSVTTSQPNDGLTTTITISWSGQVFSPPTDSTLRSVKTAASEGTQRASRARPR